jgi:hypothetical protein
LRRALRYFVEVLACAADDLVAPLVSWVAVAGVATDRSVLVVAEVLAELFVQRGLDPRVGSAP